MNPGSRSESPKCIMKQQRTSVAGKSYQTSHRVRDMNEQAQHGNGADLLPKKTSLGEAFTMVR